MLNLSQGALAKLAVGDISEKLYDAVLEAKRITNFEGKRRQMQFIGKQMRLLEETQVKAIKSMLTEQHSGSASETLALHLAQTWRDRLIADDDAFGEWVLQFPQSDSQQLRALIRQARKDAKPEKPEKSGGAVRHGRAYRDIFQMVRAALSPENAALDDADQDANYKP